jgi:hypothetical protein
MKIVWQYSSNYKRYWLDTGDFYKGMHFAEIKTCTPYGFIPGGEGFDLFIKGRLKKHGKTSGELKMEVEKYIEKQKLNFQIVGSLWETLSNG